MPRRRFALTCVAVVVASVGWATATAPAQENGTIATRQATCKNVSADFFDKEAYGAGPEGCADGPPPCVPLSY